MRIWSLSFCKEGSGLSSVVKGQQRQAFSSLNRSTSNDWSFISEQRVFYTVAVRKNSGLGLKTFFEKDRDSNCNHEKDDIQSDANFAEGRCTKTFSARRFRCSRKWGNGSSFIKAGPNGALNTIVNFACTMIETAREIASFSSTGIKVHCASCFKLKLHRTKLRSAILFGHDVSWFDVVVEMVTEKINKN